MATKKTQTAQAGSLSHAAKPGLSDLAAWFGADRWDRLEKQAATVRNWNAERFHHEAREQLAVCVAICTPECAVRVAACGLLTLLGSAPTESDRTRTTPYAAPKASA